MGIVSWISSLFKDSRFEEGAANWDSDECVRLPATKATHKATKATSPKFTRNKWTDFDEVLLHTLVHEKMTDPEIAAHMRRTVPGIRWKRRMLGITKLVQAPRRK